MKKNVASQSIGVQMVAAADGTAFTGAVSVSVTKDNGAQAAGAGTAPAHEGNGYHSYTPTQAETDADHVAFTFTGTGAIPVTVQVYTGFPQTGDSFARLGAPAGASVSADILTIDNLVDDLESRLGVPVGASISADIADVESKVDDLETRLGVPANLGGGATIAANLADIEAQTDDIGAAGAGLTALGDARLANLDATVSSRSTLTPAQVNAEVDAALDTAIPGVPTAGSINERLKTMDDADIPAAVAAVQADTNDIQARLPAALVGGRMDAIASVIAADAVDAAALKADAVAEIVAGILAGIVEGAITVKQSLQLSNAASAGKLSGAATATVTIRNLADTIDRIVATVDADGNRSAVVRTYE